jgi:antitoxin component of MazEF toxin-antitoxin module
MEVSMSRYVLNLAAKRQLTLPRKLVEELQLETGDQIELHLRGPHDIRFVPYTRVRKDILSPEIEAILQERRAAIDAGDDLISLADLDQMVANKDASLWAGEVAAAEPVALETREVVSAEE